MHGILSLAIILVSALEKIMAYHLLQAYMLEKYEERNPLALLLIRKVGPTKTYLILFFLSVLLVWTTYEYAKYSLLAGMLCLLGELIFLIDVFVNNCAWKVLHAYA